VTIDRKALLAATERALGTAETFLGTARSGLLARLAPDNALDPERLVTEQLAGHAFAWIASYVEALRQLRNWAARLDEAGMFGDIEAAILETLYGEYLAQLAGGIPMSQAEFARPQDLGITDAQTAALRDGEAGRLSADAGAARLRLGILLAERGENAFGHIGVEDPTLEMVRDQVRRFAEREVTPHAPEWHRRDELIPLPVIEELAEMGVFGMTIPEEHGGLGLGKTAMSVVSEELSRAYLGVGSLGTRSEIAGELIRLNGTTAQKARWLPAIASGAVLPTAVFTEPNTGSDLASLQTRAVRDGEVYRIHGAKTWITHGARSDLMTLLARTNSNERGYAGLSMFLAEKPRGNAADPFPAAGMSGTEIPVLGYRGMKEYEIAFDGFVVPAEALLGGVEGQGFKQLMATFESARVQTAARAVGVAQNALELGLAYALERAQFGRKLIAFPRVAGKLALMSAETMAARQLTYFAAREKDSDRRCDI
jgi:(2S)-methylsuccinyl-CoA dehydrogenase